MMVLFWELRSLKDRERLYEYLYGFNPAAADRTDELIQERASGLLEQPFMGVTRDDIKGRLLMIPEISIVLSYVVDSDAIRVLRVLHMKQKFPDR